jgi:hypothetical protein
MGSSPPWPARDRAAWLAIVPPWPFKQTRAMCPSLTATLLCHHTLQRPGYVEESRLIGQVREEILNSRS